MTERLVDAASTALAKRTSRRGLLARAALVGSALSVSPLRYLLRPISAWAAISPGGCSGGLCTDGWTEFCCQINHGSNTCPPHSYTGGWWKCTAYSGRGLCSREGVRYYVDCNRIPGQSFPGGCHCANGSCHQRRVSCNVFRYGQCNTHIAGTTEVVCRVVVCQNPASISHFNCNSSVKVENAVCGQNAGCLKPTLIQLPGAGGV